MLLKRRAQELVALADKTRTSGTRRRSSPADRHRSGEFLSTSVFSA
ncbi:MAG: hypothetical protein ACLVL7_03200 [Anaerotruncus massiliensis (ex Togo et al. 2019)]